MRWPLPSYQEWLATERFLAGEWDDALAELEAALALAAETGERDSLVHTLSVRSLLALHRGELRTAEETAARAAGELTAGSPRYRLGHLGPGAAAPSPGSPGPPCAAAAWPATTPACCARPWTPTPRVRAPSSWPWPPRTPAPPSPATATPPRPRPCCSGPWPPTSAWTRPAPPPGPRPACASWASAAAPARLGSLTPTEQRVVALVAEGLSNPQIGERLFVSRRTVQTHLAHVFAKLGISSRTQLAA